MRRFHLPQQRLLEILPGFLSWSIILFPFWGAFLVPRLVAYFTVAFLVFWFYQSFKNLFLGVRGYRAIKKVEHINWWQQYQKQKKANWLKWDKIRHIVIIPNYNEPAEKLATTSLQSLANQQDIAKKQLIVVLAMESRAKDAHQKARHLKKQFAGQFGRLLVTFHPSNLPQEIKGKAANEAWAARKVKQLLVNKEGYPLNYITVTSCDADAKFHPRYFSALTYFFARDHQRYWHLWQSPIFWYNNLNRVPIPIRIIGIIGNINHISHIQDPDHLHFNYSTYSLSLKLLDQVGYWDRDIIPEDWHLFLQAFFATRGQASVQPIFLPTSIDAPEGKTFWDALKNRYLQCQRHAWGVTDIPYAITQAKNHPEIPLSLRLARIYKMLETHILWSTNWFILTLNAWLVTLLNPRFFQTTLGYNLPKFSGTILSICLLALLGVVFIDFRLRPAAIKAHNILDYSKEFLQWLILPLASLFMAALPGLDAQTRLMLGHRLEYRTTKKLT